MFLDGGPGGIRTHDLRLRRPVPYPDWATGPVPYIIFISNYKSAPLKGLKFKKIRLIGMVELRGYPRLAKGARTSATGRRT